MRADPDFTAYVVARWTPAVRMSVLLGLPAERAEQATTGAFARMLPDWRRLTHEGDLEVELAQALAAEWSRAGATPAPRPVLVSRSPFVTPEMEDQLVLLDQLTGALAGLDGSTRATVVLHHLGELDTGQLSEALGEPPSEVHRRLAAGAAAVGLGPLDDVIRTAAPAIAVGPAPVDAVVGRANAGRRRVWLLTAALLVGLVVAAGAAYAVTRPEAPRKPQTLTALTIRAEENPVDLAWWADDTLHLVHGTTRLAGVRQLVEAGAGVVYGDADGAVVSVSDEGVRQRLGRKDPGSPLVAAAGFGLVAWVDAGSDELVVFNVLGRVETGRLPTRSEAEPVAFDQGQLYFHDDLSDWAWSMEDPPSRRVSELDLTEDGGVDPSLVDASSATQLRLEAEQLFVVQPFFSISLPLPGYAGTLSPDGNFVLAATADGDPRPSVYDARSGVAEPFWFDPAWTPEAASFDHDGRVVWVIDDGSDGPLRIYSCAASHQFVNSFDPATEPCTAGTDIGSEVPLLATRSSG